jgi:hypothetical protein
VAINFETAAISYGGYQGRQVVTAEKFGTPAGETEQNVLVTGCGAQVGMATVGLVDALDQVQFFQLFEGAINGYQAQAGILAASQVEDIEGAERTQAVSDNFDDRAPGACEPVTAGLQAIQPFADEGRSVGRREISHRYFLSIENGMHFHYTPRSILWGKDETVKVRNYLCYI